MKGRFVHFVFCAFWIVIASCGSSEKIMYTNLDKSAYLSLSHYTSVFPTLGPCGFTRSEDVYDIRTPRTNGRIESGELKIYLYSSDTLKHNYTGYIEFMNDNRVYVDLYEISKGIKTKLSINGTHKIKMEANAIGNKKV
jgi:hypothetical protein